MKELTEQETDVLKKVLDLFEHQTVCETGVRRISGGFANADYSEHDDDYVYITLKWGVQSDCADTVHTEDWKLFREELSSGKTIKDIVLEITD